MEKEKNDGKMSIPFFKGSSCKIVFTLCGSVTWQSAAMQKTRRRDSFIQYFGWIQWDGCCYPILFQAIQDTCFRKDWETTSRCDVKNEIRNKFYRIMAGKDCSRYVVYFNANEMRWYEGVLDDYLGWFRDCEKSDGTIRTTDKRRCLISLIFLWSRT